MREGEPRGTVHYRVATIQATTEIGEERGGLGCKHGSRGQLVREGETALAIDRCRPIAAGGQRQKSAMSDHSLTTVF